MNALCTSHLHQVVAIWMHGMKLVPNTCTEVQIGFTVCRSKQYITIEELLHAVYQDDLTSAPPALDDSHITTELCTGTGSLVIRGGMREEV